MIYLQQSKYAPSSKPFFLFFFQQIYLKKCSHVLLHHLIDVLSNATISMRLFLPILFKILLFPTSNSLLFLRFFFLHLLYQYLLVHVYAFGFCLFFLLKCKVHYIRDFLIVYVYIHNTQSMPHI